MTETEQQIEQLLVSLRGRQSELASEYQMNCDAIEALETLLSGGKVTSKQAQMFENVGDKPRVVSPPVEIVATKTGDAKSRLSPVLRNLDSRLSDSATFFNLSQRDAARKLLRMVGRPLPMLDILAILKRAHYEIRAKVPYQSMFSVMTRDAEIVKQGKLWGLKEWSRNGNRIESNGGQHLQVHDVPDVEERELQTGDADEN
jgi:hypothetical protein